MIIQKRTARLFIFLLLLTITLFIISLSVGYSRASVLDVIDFFLGRTSASTSLIIGRIRLPRILACVLGGASLAMSGILLQTLTRNPLADSGILGINTGAGLAVALVVSLLDINQSLVMSSMPLFSMLGGGATVLLVYLISRRPNRNISPTRLIITGVGISTMLSGIMVSIVSKIDDYKVDYIVSWLSGKITGDDWSTLIIMAPLLIIVWLLTYSRSHPLNIMNLNEQTALALGLNLQKERLINLVLSTALAAFSVVLVGNITFVGLVAGHISRRFVGSNHRLSLPASMLIGIIILLSADTVGRLFLVGTGIPTGLVVSFIGAPYFLYLMTKLEK